MEMDDHSLANSLYYDVPYIVVIPTELYKTLLKLLCRGGFVYQSLPLSDIYFGLTKQTGLCSLQGLLLFQLLFRHQRVLIDLWKHSLDEAQDMLVDLIKLQKESIVAIG